jgi:hypothetical protein
MNVHDYSAPPKIHKFTDVLFRTTSFNAYKFQVPIGLKDGKDITITNKQLSFLPCVLGHSLGPEYNAMLEKNRRTLLECLEPVAISEPVFQFFDYESVTGSGHSYDLMFYLLYHYMRNNLQSKLLVVNSTNSYYNATLKLIRKYFNIEFLYIDEGINYKFSNFECIQSYQNIFFTEVKEFVNANLIDPILKTIKIPIHENIAKLKQDNKDNITPMESPPFKPPYDALDLNQISDEDEKIFLLNNCSNLTIEFGSSFFINVCYYIKDYSNKKIDINFLRFPNDRDVMMTCKGDEIHMTMPGQHTGNSKDNIYSTLVFKGSII